MSVSSRIKSSHFLNLFIIVLIMIFAFGCAKSDQKIVGAWDNIKSPELVEFKPDGTGIFTYPNSQNPALAFNWKKAAKNSYNLDVNFMGANKTLTATISDKSLSIESPMGNELYQKHISR